MANKNIKYKLNFAWSCGCVPFCEHRTKLGAEIHAHLYYWFIWFFKYGKKIKH